MTQMKPAVQVEPFPQMRRLAPDIGWLTRSRYAIRGLLEIDVTVPRQIIREHKARTSDLPHHYELAALAPSVGLMRLIFELEDNP
jgi:hypothetical protein